MDRASDEQLLLRAADGDDAAFTELVRRHHRAIVQFAYRFLGRRDRHTAEDLAQHVFLEAWRRAADFEPRAKVTTWLFRIATNACLNQRRYMRPRATVPLDAEQPDRSLDAQNRVELDEAGERVRAAIVALPDNQRAAIVLRHYHGFSYAEIAEIIGASASAVDSLLQRARAALREQLATPGDSQDASAKNENSPQDSSPSRAQQQ